MGLNPDDLADDTTPTGQQQQQAPPGQQQPITDFDTAMKALRDARKEAGSYRVRAKAAEGRLAALDADGSGRITLAKHEETIRSLKLENGLISAAHAQGIGNVRLLRAYLDTAGSLRDLSPDEPTFAEDISSIVAETVENEPALKGGVAGSGNIPPTTGAHFGGPPPPPQQLSRQHLAGMTPEEVNQAREAGWLDQLLGRR